MLSINPIARVTVRTVRATRAPSAFDTGLLLVKDENFTPERRLQAFSSAESAAETLRALGFAESSLPYQSAVRYFGASPAPGRLLLSCFPPAETESAAIDAVLEQTAAFYGVFVPANLTRTEALALADHMEALEKDAVLFLPVTGTPAEAADPGGLLRALFDGQYRRALPFYCESLPDTAALLGTAMGLEAAHSAGAFALCYKTLSGAVPSPLTQAQADAIEGLNGNVYVARGSGRLLLEKGSVASGLRYDEVLYLDRIADDLRSAAASLLADNPDRLPQTDDTSELFMNRFTSILMTYTDRGILAAAPWRGGDTGPLRAGDMLENGFRLWADSYDTQSDADRAAHRAVPIQIALALAGSLESVVVSVSAML